MVNAVVERRGGVKLADADVFAASVGGVRIAEPAADLALALAIASAAKDTPLPPGVVALGEVGLSGEIRRVGGTGRRLAEAARQGYKVALVPPDAGRRAGGHAAGRGARPGRRLRPAVLTLRRRGPLQVVGLRGRRPGGPTAGAGSGVHVDSAPAASRPSGASVSAAVDPDVALRELLGRIAPGTALRDGLERILAGRTGALIVLGYDRVVESLCTGGFALDVALSATRLRELAKMDGAVIVSYDGTRIVRAGVHLMPDPTIPTEESGTRHRTAERVALQTGFPVISVSQSMHIISVYVAGRRYTLEHPTTILARANQALAALERYKLRLDEVASTLSALEIEDLVTVRDAMSVSQRLEMVRRIADEIEGFVVELGTDGRLLALQLDEMLAGVEEDRGLLVRDYLPRRPQAAHDRAGAHRPAGADGDRAARPSAVARCYGLPTSPDALDSPVSPRGYRLLARVPRLPAAIIDRLVDHFGGLQKLLAATIEDLLAVEGVGEARARGIREGLSRLAETSILDRYS